MSIIDPQGAATALGLATSALSSVKTALELAKKTSDRDLKTEIGLALDNVIDLKLKMYELVEENRSLREQLKQKATITRNSEFGYYFAEGDSDPLCPKCYEGNGKSIHLSGKNERNGGIRRSCIECKHTFTEQKTTGGSGVLRRTSPWG
jgi:hypothetical protein